MALTIPTKVRQQSAFDLDPRWIDIAGGNYSILDRIAQADTKLQALCPDIDMSTWDETTSAVFTELSSILTLAIIERQSGGAFIAKDQTPLFNALFNQVLEAVDKINRGQMQYDEGGIWKSLSGISTPAYTKYDNPITDLMEDEEL